MDLETRKCIVDIQAAESFSMETLLAVIEGNSAACEALSDEGVLLRSRVAILLEDARRRASDLVRGLEEPTRAPPSSSFVGALFTTRPRDHEAAAAVSGHDGGTPEMVACGRQAAQKAISLLAELDGLGQRLEKLQSCWPNLRATIAHAKERREPFKSGTLTVALGEALSWRQSSVAALHDSESICAQLFESIEWCHTVQVERQRWRELTRKQLSEMDKPVAARVTAVLWTRRARGFTGQLSIDAPGSSFEGATESLAQNLEAAEVLQRRLVRCASAVMRSEAERAAVEQAVQKLAMLKHSLCLAAERASSVERQLVEAPSAPEDFVEIVQTELHALFAVADRVSIMLAGCPLDDDNAAQATDIQDMEAFEAWIRERLLRDSP